MSDLPRMFMRSSCLSGFLAHFRARILRPSPDSLLNQFFHGSKFFPGDSKFRRTHIRIADAQLLLHQFDELNELRNCIEAQQREKPSIQFESLDGPACD